MADNKKTKKPKNDLTDVKNVHEDTLAFNANGNVSGTISTNTLIINQDDATSAEIKSNKEYEKPTKFSKLVERYMRCEKRTLAEMLAMRDTEDEDWSKDFNFNEELQKILDSDDISEYMEKVALEKYGYAYPDERRFYEWITNNQERT
jgi:hypothetical protein